MFVVGLLVASDAIWSTTRSGLPIVDQIEAQGDDLVGPSSVVLVHDIGPKLQLQLRHSLVRVT